MDSPHRSHKVEAPLRMVRAFMHDHTEALLRDRRKAAEDKAAGKGAAKKKAPGGKKGASNYPELHPYEAKAWEAFLIDVRNKVYNLRHVTLEEFWCALQHLSDGEKRNLAAIYQTVNPKLFPPNYDGVLAHLKGVIGQVAMGWQYRVPTAFAVSGKPPAAVRAEGAGPGYMLAAGFSPEEVRSAGFTARELLGAGVTLRQLREVGATAFEVSHSGKAGGCPFAARDFREAGYGAQELATVFAGKELLDGGFTKEELALGGVLVM